MFLDSLLSSRRLLSDLDADKLMNMAATGLHLLPDGRLLASPKEKAKNWIIVASLTAAFYDHGRIALKQVVGGF